jgi:hypothetical protein
MSGNRPRLIVAVISLVLLVSIAWIGSSAWARRRDTRSVSASSVAQTPHLERVSAAPSGHDAKPPSAPVSTPAGFVYTVPSAQPLATVVHKFWSQTRFMTRSELETALRQANALSKSGYLKSGQQVVIPGYEPDTPADKPDHVAPDFEVRAVYLTGIMAGSVNGLRIVEHWRQLGGNAIVFDVKDSDGSVNIPFQHALAPHRTPAIPNLPKYVRWAHSQGLHVIARIALFRDENIAQHHSELAVRSRRSGQPWMENGKLVWTDPSNTEVQDYNIALAKTAAQSGVDEVQFDYVRFPAEGDQADAQFAFQSCKNHVGADVSSAQSPRSGEPCATTRADVIEHFLHRAYDELHPMGVLVSLDVFGVMAWQRPVDLNHTGQDIVRMARWCDVLSPMIYPSHFFGMDGIAHPGDAPEHFIAESMERFAKITRNRVDAGAAGVANPSPGAPSKPDVGLGGHSPRSGEARVAADVSSAQSPRSAEAHSVVLRPWLQAFAWRTKTYSPEYIRIQVAAAKAKGGIGFLFWNARNDYSKPMAAMPEMRSQRLFRGDELPTAKSATAVGRPASSPATASDASASADPGSPRSPNH